MAIPASPNGNLLLPSLEIRIEERGIEPLDKIIYHSKQKEGTGLIERRSESCVLRIMGKAL
jgi:hypothetical protein